MNDKELKEYIDGIKKDMTGLINEARHEMVKLEECIKGVKKELGSKMEKLKEFQLTCPLLEELRNIKGRVFRNNILVYFFMTGLMALAWLQLQNNHSVHPEDVLKKLEVLEKKIDAEIERERIDDQMDMNYKNRK